MKKLRKEDIKEKIAEDYCFVCKDGGDLRICDYGGCLKCYHHDCEDKEESFLDSKERWTCRWHQCSLCHRPSKFQCFTCPTAVCGTDLYYSAFAQVKGQKGFCADCLHLAYIIEKDMDAVSVEGVKIDFKVKPTYERYFREYYEIIKEKDGVTAQMTLSAMAAYEKGKQLRLEPDYEDVYPSDDDGLVSEYDDIGDEEPSSCRVNIKRKRPYRRKGPSGRTRKNDKPDNSKFNGWGTNSLIVFLNSVGEDTTKPLTQCDVDSIIRRYIHSNKLVEKKMVSCDEKLQSLFRRKTVKIHQISGLLESHFAENVVHSNQDDGINTTRLHEEGDSRMPPCQSEKKIVKCLELKIQSTKKSCYAAIVAENIKLVYMRRTLVERLLKTEAGIGKDKVVGSIVRIKSDPYDCMQKNSYQLVLVTGVSEASSSDQITLQVGNRIKYIPLSDISEEDFSSEECDDLRRRVEAGLFKKITVMDLEQKGHMLREDITKHWITRRITILQNLIDHANEKGRRRELNEYLEAKELLQTGAEQSRLLLEVPTVIADETTDPPSTNPERTTKPEIGPPPGFQTIKSESSSFSNGSDLPGTKSSNFIEVNKLQIKEGTRKKMQDLNDQVVLPSPSKRSPVLGLRAISDAAFDNTSSNSSSVSNSWTNSETAVEDDTSSPSSRVYTMTNIFLNCLKLDFPTLFSSNNQSSFLQSLTTLSNVGDFSLKQIDAMENLIYEFPRLTSDYQFAEDTMSKFQRFMQLRSSLPEDAKQYISEREIVEAQVKSASEKSLNIQEKIRQLNQELKAVNSQKKDLIYRKVSLDAKIMDTDARIAQSSLDFDSWKIRQRKAIKERETVLAAWESFKKHFPNIDDPVMVSALRSTQLMNQQTANASKETRVNGQKRPSVVSTNEGLTKVKSADHFESILLQEVPTMVLPHRSSTRSATTVLMPQNSRFENSDVPQPNQYIPITDPFHKVFP